MGQARLQGMSIHQLSPLGIPRPRPAPGLPDRARELPAQADEVQPGKGRRQVMAAGLLGLVGVGALGGAGLHQAAHAPICQQSQQIVGWESGLCVSNSVGVGGATAWRYLQTPFHVKDALQTWDSGHHQVIPAPPQAAETSNPQDLQVISWNLHHGQSQDSTGARPQLDTMIDTLQEYDADILLLQEVNPKDASRLARELGMQGYFAASTPVQGNMILLRPDFQVREDQVVVTTPEKSAGATLKDWLIHGGGIHEPRTLQILDVTLPNGESAVIWNTHHLTGSYTPEQQEIAASRLGNALEESIQPGELVIGGGDLNANRDSHPLLARLNALEGVSGEALNIDWIYSSDSMPREFFSQRVEAEGRMVSDHPLVGARLQLPS